ncbi:hypothetical protein WDW89_14140 [Deltaproteobacteria bacterium TL4]
MKSKKRIRNFYRCGLAIALWMMLTGQTIRDTKVMPMARNEILKALKVGNLSLDDPGLWVFAGGILGVLLILPLFIFLIKKYKYWKFKKHVSANRKSMVKEIKKKRARKTRPKKTVKRKVSESDKP